MAYDPIKAHEYYEKYVKKGLKKGRKKGNTDKKTTGKKGSKKKGTAKKSTSKKASLVGISTSGLNDSGRIEAALAKDRLTKQMNDALSKEPTDEGKEKIRREYSQKALNEMNKLKNDPKYATPKKEKKSSSKGSSKGSSKSGDKESSKKDSANKKAETIKFKKSQGITINKRSSGGASSGASSHSSSTASTPRLTDEQKKHRQELIDRANELKKDFESKIGNMTAAQRLDFKEKLSTAIDEIKKKLRKIS